MKIVEVSPYSSDAIILMDELSMYLEELTGNSGKASFRAEDVSVPRSLFAIAYDDFDKPIGCGGIRPLSEDIAEVKRMYSRVKSLGIGTEVLTYLEKEAFMLDYKIIRIETRLLNAGAVKFYESWGYDRIKNYGKYENRPEAVCFEKVLKATC